MKKTLIALAAVAASGAAFAQSSVTLYGIVDASVAYVKGADGVAGVEESGQNASRFGFKGTEDLGNGLKAEFVLEGMVNNDDGGSGLNFQRQSTIGLSGGFGAVRLGRELTASYNAVSRYDPFGTNGIGAARHWTGDTGYNVRYSNGIAYYTPSFSGFQAGVNLGFGEQTKAKTGRQIGLGLTYDNGPISFGLGFDKSNNVKNIALLGESAYEEAYAEQIESGAGVSAAEIAATAARTAALNQEVDLKTVHVGGSYDFGVAKLGLAYKQTDYKDADGKSKLKGFLVGVSAPVGAAGLVKASYNHYKLEDAKVNQLSLGYVHNLSKRTSLYGTYSFIKNKEAGLLTLNGASSTGLNAGLSNSGKQQGIQFGISHKF